jgi:hypothetical protein
MFEGNAIRTSSLSRDSDGKRSNLSCRSSNRLDSLGLLGSGLLLLLLSGLLLVSLQATEKATRGGSALLLLLSLLSLGLLDLGGTSGNDRCA